MDIKTSTDLRYQKKRAFFPIFVLYLLLPLTAVAQQHNIVDIRVSGTVHASEKMIRNVAALTIGSELGGTEIQDAVKNLYAKGIFKDIVIDAEPSGGGVVVTIIVSEYPQLTKIVFDGNKKISDDDLKELLHLTPGGYIGNHLMIQAKNKIETEYMSKGYFLAEADPRLEYTSDSAKAELTFEIKEYSKVKVEEVILTGNDRLVAKDLVNKMSNRKRGFLRSSDFKKEKYPEDKEKIIEYCREKGFIDAYIVSDSFAIDTSRNRMTIYVEIFEGPKYYFGEAVFSGNELYDDDLLHRVLKFETGHVFDQGKYDESLGELYSAFQEKGYLRTRILDIKKTRDSTIDIEYEITEGLPSQVRLIDIVGNTKTKDKVIRREMKIRPGDTFRRSALMRTLRDIMQLNYFSDVAPDIRDLPSGDIDLVLKVEEKPTGQVSAGAGYSGQDKLVGTFGLGIPNFRGNGQNISINVDFGSRRNSISLGFTEPWFLGTPTLVGGDIYSLNRRWYSDFTEGRRGGALRLGRRLKWPDNYFRVFWRYRLEDVRYHDFSDAYKLQNGETEITSLGETRYIPLKTSLEKFGEDWLRTSAMSFTIERDSRDLPIFATSGSRISYTAEIAGGILGGKWEYFKHMTDLQYHVPLAWGMSLVGKAKFGYISSTDIDLITFSERFTPGGTDVDGIVRGYPDAELSPRNRAGGYEPGIAEAIYNLELQIPIISGQIYVIGFADAGAAWLSRDEVRPFSNLYRGVGGGFRIVVPGVGVIGFDFGYALDELRGEEKGWRPHFQVLPGY